MTRRSMTVGLLTLLLAAVTTLVTAPAHAAGELGLSRDGVTWGTSLTKPLFDPAILWVPGDSRTASFKVRNQTSDRAILDVVLLNDITDSLMEDGSLVMSAKAGAGDWVTLHGSTTVGQSLLVEPGQHTTVLLRAALTARSTNANQRTDLELRFNVRLTQGDPGLVKPPVIKPPKPPQSGAAGMLPATGNLIRDWWVSVGLVLTSAGAVLIARRRKDEDHV